MARSMSTSDEPSARNTALASDLPRTFAGNGGIAATGVITGCAAVLQAVNMPLFELGQWQSWSSIGRHPVEAIALGD